MQKIKNCSSRIKPFKMIFLIKMGKIVNLEDCNKCFRVNKLISFFFYLYYSGLFLLVYFLMFHYIDVMVGNNTISLILSFLLYLVLEIGVVLIIPLKKIDCPEKV